jgi:hypothetical protein
LQNIANAHEAGFHNVGVYMWPQRALPPVVQANQLLMNLELAGAQYSSIMLDIEGDNWLAHTPQDNQEFVMSLVDVFQAAGVPVAIYCSWQFNSTFGTSFTALSDLPLIYAHYDNIPSYVDIQDSLFGGWSSPAGKQFFDGMAGEQVCSSGMLDWDWSETPWW